MIVLSAWTFGTWEGASHSATVLRDLVERGLVQVVSAVVVGWGATARAPRVTRAAGSATGVPRRPEFLDLLFGMTYAVPLLEAAVGAGHTEPAGALVGMGVDETFTNKMRDRLVPGSSALLVLSEDGAVERLRIDLDQPDHPELVSIGVEIAPDLAGDVE